MSGHSPAGAGMALRSSLGAARLTAHAIAPRQGRSQRLVVRASDVLIVNTKGGGHAFIGLHLAEQLLGKKHSVTIFNDGDEVRSLIAIAVKETRCCCATNHFMNYFKSR
jgi:hypothetical protein